MIDRPAGPVSKGVCRLCNEERDFQNYVEGGPWRYESSSLENMSGGSRLLAGVDVPKDRDSRLYDEEA